MSAIAAVAGLLVGGATSAAAVTPAPGLVADVEVLVIDGVAPGRPGAGEVQLTNVSEHDLAVAAVSRSSGALTETANLLVEVRSCTQAWQHGSCQGDELAVIAHVDAPAGAARVLATPFVLAPGVGTHLRVVVSLPDTAGNESQNLTAALSFTWTATLDVPVPGDPSSPAPPATDPPTHLPVTGAAGTAVLVAGAGSALVAGGLLLAAGRRRQGRDAQ